MIIQTNSLEIFKTNIYTPMDIGWVSNNSYLSVVATNKCNRACPYCINSETDHSLQMPIAKMRRTVKEAVDRYGIKEAIILGGEPTLHPEICQMISGLKESGIVVVRLTTNGIALTNELLGDMIDAGLDGLNVSYHNRDFISIGRLSTIHSLCYNRGVKVRVNTNIWRGNHDSVDSFLGFYNNDLLYRCDEVRVSNIIPKDSFSVNPTNSDESAKMILSNDEYNAFFTELCERYENLTLIENPNTLGFVRYILIPAELPIIVNWNIGSRVAEQVCENDIANRKINTFKCLVSGNISLSWNEGNTIIR